MSTHANSDSSSARCFADYYQAIIPDRQAFLEVGQQPLPTTFWVNSLKISSAALQQSLQSDDYSLERLAWHESAFRYTQSRPLGLTWQYRVGLLQIQEEVSMLAGQVLQPQPGERVLDLCAAPGNKTAQMAVSMGNQGMLVANDRSYQRLRAMGQIIKRLGLININTTVYDGSHFPLVADGFDKVLVDAPCSCEGTFRKNLAKLVRPNPQNNRRMASQQIVLLKRGLQLCRPGGLILYSTCTFAPEENEAVIDCLLRKHDAEVELLPISLTGFASMPGITQWHDQQFDTRVQLTHRIWPYQNNTGGFFLALLRKKAAAVTCPLTYQPECKEELKVYLQQIQQRYAFPPELLSQYAFSDVSRKGFYVRHPQNRLPDCIRSDASGLLFMKIDTQFPKLTTAAAMLLGHAAQRNIISLTQQQLARYMQREEFELQQAQLSCLSDTGFVIVCFQGVVLGSGLFFTSRDGQPARLRSLFPRYL